MNQAKAPAAPRRPKGKPPQQPHGKELKRKRDADDLAALEARIANLDTSGGAPDTGAPFAALPLSAATAAGLAASHFKTQTEVQRRAIPPALQGRDVLGAAKTGSGKTLAFLVPLLEALHRAQWTEHDGLGALVLAPTRELAAQIFGVLRRVGRRHRFGAGLVIGGAGRGVREEAERLGRIAVLVSTPGRVLQHLDQSALLDVTNLRLLVLDEADRILDLGFRAQVDAILEHLPRDRQTLLFSATQTRSVADLARLSLREPAYVSAHEGAAAATPSTLTQSYVEVRLPDKLDTLWGFIRANLKAKILVFASSGKQVRFVYEAFRRMQPGTPLLHLLGRQRQSVRLDIVSRFAASKTSCMFATDVAARGLDFPAVDWVVQLDCPEDADTYIHRAGRTARFDKEGKAVLFLDPSEKPGMLKRLQEKKVPIEEIKVRTKKQLSVKSQLQNMCFQDPELKYLGQKAFVSYAKSLHLQKDKEVFKINELPLEEFSASMGLPGAPVIKFRKGDDPKKAKNAPRARLDSDSESGADKPKKGEVRTKYDRMFDRRNQGVLAPHYTSMLGDAASADQPDAKDADEDADFLTVKRRLSISSQSSFASSEERSAAEPPPMKIDRKSLAQLPIDSLRRKKLLASHKKLLNYGGRGHKLVFDEDGNAHEEVELRDEAAFAAEGAPEELRQAFVAGEQGAMGEADVADKAVAKEKRKAKREKKRERERAEKEDEEEGRGAVLAPYDDEESGDGGYEDEEGYGSGESGSEGGQVERKWFQRDSDEERTSKRRKANAPAEAETLEDLEALAESFL